MAQRKIAVPDSGHFHAVRFYEDAASLAKMVYGEMVDVLWKDGQETAAIRLEILWNQLANTRKFSLLCGYSMGSFYKNAAFEDICQQHTHMVSAGGATAPVPLSTARVTPVH